MQRPIVPPAFWLVAPVLGLAAGICVDMWLWSLPNVLWPQRLMPDSFESKETLDLLRAIVVSLGASVILCIFSKSPMTCFVSATLVLLDLGKFMSRDSAYELGFGDASMTVTLCKVRCRGGDGC
jgi:hypothetical protein